MNHDNIDTDSATGYAGRHASDVDPRDPGFCRCGLGLDAWVHTDTTHYRETPLAGGLASMTSVAELMKIIQTHPGRLPAAPDYHGVHEITHRAKNETHPCAACGEPAGAALVVGTLAGKRWVDVCPDCYCRLLRLPPFEGNEP